MAVEEAITSLLSGVVGGRRYWGRGEGVSATAGAYLVINRISGRRDYTLAGADGYVASRFQIDAYADTFSGAREAASDAIAVLSGSRGTVAGSQILGIFVDSERDLPASDAGEVSHLFRRSVDVLVHHGE